MVAKTSGGGCVFGVGRFSSLITFSNPYVELQ
jgi:hypothetical protein